LQACGRAAVEKAVEPNTVRDRGTSKRPSCAERIGDVFQRGVILARPYQLSIQEHASEVIRHTCAIQIRLLLLLLLFFFLSLGTPFPREPKNWL